MQLRAEVDQRLDAWVAHAIDLVRLALAEKSALPLHQLQDEHDRTYPASRKLHVWCSELGAGGDVKLGEYVR